MKESQLTPQEYELHLKDLRERLTLFLDAGSGDPRQLMKDTEAVLEMADAFPEVFRRYEDVEGMVGELLARHKQSEFLSQQSGPREAPGCLLGWLFGKRG